ncbi:MULTISPECIES: thioredoxin family protein [Sphingobacterium]|uniref:thioredoxin family protein n=1 Tax=Sphingobacterium TaxID=28453 RepID=UPI000FA8391F|nr:MULTISPECIES: thioredoxin family protein [Sphingobacterium]MCS4167943.1 thioredoxin-related protein [Sphingobacterium sp. BIGb0116]
MKTLLNTLVLTLLCYTIHAQNRLNVAKQQALTQHKLILLNFSGSDWCIPCIKLHKNIIDSEQFKQLINDQIIVFLNADFPRSKKNQLPVEQKKENANLADQYNPTGIFPYTLLLDANGKILKSWAGLPPEDPANFCDEIRTVYNQITRP